MHGVVYDVGLPMSRGMLDTGNAKSVRMKKHGADSRLRNPPPKHRHPEGRFTGSCGAYKTRSRVFGRGSTVDGCVGRKQA